MLCISSLGFPTNNDNWRFLWQRQLAFKHSTNNRTPWCERENEGVLGLNSVLHFVFGFLHTPETETDNTMLVFN